MSHIVVWSRKSLSCVIAGLIIALSYVVVRSGKSLSYVVSRLRSSLSDIIARARIVIAPVGKPLPDVVASGLGTALSDPGTTLVG